MESRAPSERSQEGSFEGRKELPRISGTSSPINDPIPNKKTKQNPFVSSREDVNVSVFGDRSLGLSLDSVDRSSKGYCDFTASISRPKRSVRPPNAEPLAIGEARGWLESIEMRQSGEGERSGGGEEPSICSCSFTSKSGS